MRQRSDKGPTQGDLTKKNTNWNDRFGYGHADDSESVGPHAGMGATRALAKLLDGLAQRGIGRPLDTTPGLYVDASGHLSDSPFPNPNPYASAGPGSSPSGFTGAVGVVVSGPKGPVTYCVGSQVASFCRKKGVVDASGWATFDGTRDSGTAGTTYPYSVSTAGVLLASGQALLADVFAGARATASHDPILGQLEQCVRQGNCEGNVPSPPSAP
ncbi:MAG: hypothetical protein ACYDD6_03335 [Acidimicrobiales bacterium]